MKVTVQEQPDKAPKYCCLTCAKHQKGACPERYAEWGGCHPIMEGRGWPRCGNCTTPNKIAAMRHCWQPIPDRCGKCKHEYEEYEEKGEQDPIETARVIWDRYWWENPEARLGATNIWLHWWFQACRDTDKPRLKELCRDVPDNELAIALASWVKWSMNECVDGEWTLGDCVKTCPSCMAHDKDCRLCTLGLIAPCLLAPRTTKTPWRQAAYPPHDKAALVAALWTCVERALERWGK